MRVLVTGGAGYIGSHTCVELLEVGHEVFVIDNFCNGYEIALERVQHITNCELQYMNADIRDENALEKMNKNTNTPIKMGINRYFIILFNFIINI